MDCAHFPCPAGAASITMALWTHAWLAGRVSPDAAIEAMTPWAQMHLAVAADAAAAGVTGLPLSKDTREPSGPSQSVGVAALLAAARRAGPDVRVAAVLPAPGDVTGTVPGTAHAAAAIAAGESVIIHGCAAPGGNRGGGGDACLGLVPMRESADVIRWSAYSIGGCAPPADVPGLGETRRALLEAVREATEVLGGVARVGGDGAYARREVAWRLEDSPSVPPPPGTPRRAIEVFDTASTVAAILRVVAERTAGSAHSAAAAGIQESGLRSLADSVRRARVAATAAALGASGVDVMETAAQRHIPYPAAGGGA